MFIFHVHNKQQYMEFTKQESEDLGLKQVNFEGNITVSHEGKKYKIFKCSEFIKTMYPAIPTGRFGCEVEEYE